MSVVNVKDIPTKKNSLGQFFTPKNIVDLCIQHTKIETQLVIEPSCGQGVFLQPIRKLSKNIIALEVDENLACSEQVRRINFYDFNDTCKDVTFVGNPPFHTPAVSVTDNPVYGRKDFIHKLLKKYDVKGIREEAVFFIMKSVDLILFHKDVGIFTTFCPKTSFIIILKHTSLFFHSLENMLD